MGKVCAILYIQDALNSKFHERKIYNSPVCSAQPLVPLGEKKARKSFALFTDSAEWGRVCSRNTGLDWNDFGPPSRRVGLCASRASRASQPYQAMGYGDGFRMICVYLCVTAVSPDLRGGAGDVGNCKIRAIGRI